MSKFFRILVTIALILPLEAAGQGPPLEVVTRPPADVATRPPVDVVTRPPVEVVTRPPVEFVTRPPVIYVNVTNPTERSSRGCEDNEIYIVDGERTLIITNNKMARDIDHIQV